MGCAVEKMLSAAPNAGRASASGSHSLRGKWGISLFVCVHVCVCVCARAFGRAFVCSHARVPVRGCARVPCAHAWVRSGVIACHKPMQEPGPLFCHILISLISFPGYLGHHVVAG